MYGAGKLLSLNRNTVATQPSTEKAHVPQPTTHRYTERLYGTARNHLFSIACIGVIAQGGA